MPPRDNDLPGKFRMLDSAIGRWGIGTVFAMIFLAAGLYGVYWIIADIAKPVSLKHIEFLTVKIEESKEIRRAQTTIAEAVKILAEAKDRYTSNSQRLIELIDLQNKTFSLEHARQSDEHKAAAEKLECIDSKIKRP